MAADVRIWFQRTDTMDPGAIAAAAAVLSDEERAQYHRFHFSHDARDYAAAHALLRHSLSGAAPRPPASWRFEKTPAGKPFLVGAGADAPSFSLSHTTGMVACAITDGADIGVDVEGVDRRVNADDIAARFFAPSEAAWLRAQDEGMRRDRFFDLWTLKEALVKALGAGMAMSLASLAFSVQPGGSVTLEAPADVDASAWQFGLFAPGPGHRLAVAVRRSGDAPARLICRAAEDAS